MKTNYVKLANILLFIAFIICLVIIVYLHDFKHQTILMKYVPVIEIYDDNETGFVAVVYDSRLNLKTDIQFAYGDTIPFKVGDKIMIGSFVKQRIRNRH
jgi:hypothetical protein